MPGSWKDYLEGRTSLTNFTYQGTDPVPVPAPVPASAPAPAPSSSKKNMMPPLPTTVPLARGGKRRGTRRRSTTQRGRRARK